MNPNDQYLELASLKMRILENLHNYSDDEIRGLKLILENFADDVEFVRKENLK